MIMEKLQGRIETDRKVIWSWWSTRCLTGGAVFAAIAFAISLSSAGMQFIGVFGLRLTLLVCFVIFVCAFIGRICKQAPSQGDDQGQSGP